MQIINDIFKEFDERDGKGNFVHDAIGEENFERIKSFFRTKLIAILETDIERLEGMIRFTRNLESTYRNRFIDQEIAHRRAAIKALQENNN